MDVSGNSGTPKSSILIGFSIINHPCWGTPTFGHTHIDHQFGIKVATISFPISPTNGIWHIEVGWTDST